jgi:hypothetical protein
VFLNNRSYVPVLSGYRPFAAKAVAAVMVSAIAPSCDFNLAGLTEKSPKDRKTAPTKVYGTVI